MAVYNVKVTGGLIPRSHPCSSEEALARARTFLTFTMEHCVEDRMIPLGNPVVELIETANNVDTYKASVLYIQVPKGVAIAYANICHVAKTYKVIPIDLAEEYVLSYVNYLTDGLRVKEGTVAQIEIDLSAYSEEEFVLPA